MHQLLQRCRQELFIETQQCYSQKPKNGYILKIKCYLTTKMNSLWQCTKWDKSHKSNIEPKKADNDRIHPDFLSIKLGKPRKNYRHRAVKKVNFGEE